MSTGDLLEPGWRSTMIEVNGLTLHVVEAGPADGPLLVLPHGLPEFWWARRRQVAPLAEAGWRVAVPDMRGYDLGDAPQEVAAHRLDVLAADVVALADALGADGFDLVGHDWGAVVAGWVAARPSERLRRPVAMCGRHPDVWGGQALRSAYVAFLQLPWARPRRASAPSTSLAKALMRASAHAGTFEPGALERNAEAWAHPGSLAGMLDYYRALRQRPAGRGGGRDPLGPHRAAGPGQRRGPGPPGAGEEA